MATTRYHGKSGRIAVSSTGTGSKTTVASMSGWKLSKKTDKAEVTSFGDSNKVYVQGLPDVSGTLTGWFDTADSAMLTASESADGANLILYQSTNAAGFYHYGPAWLDYDIDCSVSGPIAISVSFVAAGSWSHQP